jgi:hypothetical protein
MPQRETLLRLRLSSAIIRGGSHADDHTEISATPSHLAALVALFVALSGPASAQSITAITAIPQAGNNIFKNLGHGLQVATI